MVRYDYPSALWERLIPECGFTDRELELIPYLRRGKSGIETTLALNISLSTYNRLKSSITGKIFAFVTA